MISPKIILCAKGISRDAETDAVSVFSIIEGISAPKFPVVVAEMWVFSFVERDGDVSEKMDLEWCIHLGNKKLASHKAKIDFEGKRRHRLFLQIRGLKIEGPGDLTVSLDYGGQCTVDTRIDVKKT